MVRKAIPVTSVTRTLIDLGMVADARELELALESALRKGLTSPQLLGSRLAQFPARSLKHVRFLRDLLNERPTVGTESALETLVWRLLREEGLREPLRQYEVFGGDGRFIARVDLAYPHEKVAIEADGFRFHSGREDFHRDRRRSNALAAMGWTVYRVTWEDATRRGRVVGREVAELLDRRAAAEPTWPTLPVRRRL